jgi:DNA repair exonuclease SbcCD ATPase subunit
MQLVVELEDANKKITEVQTSEGAQEASDLLKQATQCFKSVESARLEVNRPLNSKIDQINALANGVKARLKSVQDTLKKHLDVYTAALEAKRKQEEAAKQAETQRLLEEQRKIQQQLEERQKAAAAAAAPQTPVTGNKPLTPEVKPAPVANAGAALAAQLAAKRSQQITQEIKALAKTEITPAKPAGIARTVSLEFDVVDVKLVPEFLLKPRVVDDSAVRAQYCTGWKEGDVIPSVPGLQFRSATNIKSGR